MQWCFEIEVRIVFPVLAGRASDLVHGLISLGAESLFAQNRVDTASTTRLGKHLPL